MIQFWFNAGLRPGKMIALRWSKANLEAGTVWRGSTPRPFIGADRHGWWSWGDSNPRPQAFIAQFYMFSDLI
jgi:hypothetical protein